MTISEVSKEYELTQDTLRYYERTGMIPHVTRTSGGIRNYTQQDCGWVGLAKCMRSAGLPVGVMVEYVRLYQEGETTVAQRLQLLVEQKAALLKQREQIEVTLDRLTQKISRYQVAVKTGKFPPL